MTYLMTDQSKLVKIGKSKNPKERFISLRTGNPTIKMIAYSERDIEIELHRYFSHKRFRYEWFKLTEEDIKLAKAFLKGDMTFPKKGKTGKKIIDTKETRMAAAPHYLNSFDDIDDVKNEKIGMPKSSSEYKILSYIVDIYNVLPQPVKIDKIIGYIISVECKSRLIEQFLRRVQCFKHRKTSHLYNSIKVGETWAAEELKKIHGDNDVSMNKILKDFRDYFNLVRTDDAKGEKVYRIDELDLPL